MRVERPLRPPIETPPFDLGGVEIAPIGTCTPGSCCARSESCGRSEEDSRFALRYYTVTVGRVLSTVASPVAAPLPPLSCHRFQDWRRVV